MPNGQIKTGSPHITNQSEMYLALNSFIFATEAVETEMFDPQAFSEKCSERLSATKSQITSHPSDALTSLVQDLLDKVSTASVYE